MTVYYVDDGGDGTNNGDSWAHAYTSINALDTAQALASGDIVYLGHDHNCQAVNVGALTITGPTSGLPAIFISATQGSNPPTYAKGTGAQIDTTEGAFSVTLDGSFALYGLRLVSGSSIIFSNDVDESFFHAHCTFSIIGSLSPHDGGGTSKGIDTTIDIANSGSVATAVFASANAGGAEFHGIAVTGNPQNRSGFIAGGTGVGRVLRISGADFSGFTHATPCELINSAGSSIYQFTNCLTKASPVLFSGTAAGVFDAFLTNVGPADDPTMLAHKNYFGDTLSSSSIYRSSGAEIETANVGWLITTNATCGESAPYSAPWIYGTVAAGSKTFDIYITNDTADFTDAEVWLEVEYLKDSDEAQWFLASDQRVITATPANQTDDTGSTWNGSGPSFTFKQKLSVTVTVGEAGQFRARVVVGLASIAGSRFFYIDPKVTVT